MASSASMVLPSASASELSAWNVARPVGGAPLSAEALGALHEYVHAAEGKQVHMLAQLRAARRMCVLQVAAANRTESARAAFDAAELVGLREAQGGRAWAAHRAQRVWAHVDGLPASERGAAELRSYLTAALEVAVPRANVAEVAEEASEEASASAAAAAAAELSCAIEGAVATVGRAKRQLSARDVACG
eukprot:2863993-Prymnesium_polylepis.1